MTEPRALSAEQANAYLRKHQERGRKALEVLGHLAEQKEWLDSPLGQIVCSDLTKWQDAALFSIASFEGTDEDRAMFRVCSQILQKLNGIYQNYYAKRDEIEKASSAVS